MASVQFYILNRQEAVLVTGVNDEAIPELIELKRLGGLFHQTDQHGNHKVIDMATVTHFETFSY